MGDHDYFTAGPTSLSIPRSGCLAIFAGDKPRKNPDGTTRISLSAPFLLLPPEMWKDEQGLIEKVARLLNENAGAFFDSAGDDQRGAALKLKRQKEQISGLTETVRKAKHTIKELKRKVRNQTAGETRDIEQLIRCQIRIENQRQEIDRLRRKEAVCVEDTELARLRTLIAGLDPDHWGLQARVVALKAQALREGGA